MTTCYVFLYKIVLLGGKGGQEAVGLIGNCTPGRNRVSGYLGPAT